MNYLYYSKLKIKINKSKDALFTQTQNLHTSQTAEIFKIRIKTKVMHALGSKRVN